jgi:D-amino-acid dehydrogenase
VKVTVIGAGVIGVTTAYELARDGHEVTVIERHPEAASETSYANAGLVAPGHAYTWSSPKAPRILLRSLFDQRQALLFRPNLDPKLWSWSARFLRNCTSERANINTKRKVRLCIYSQCQLSRVVSETGVKYDGSKLGLVYLFRKPNSFERGTANASILRDEGLELRAITIEAAVRIDPALKPIREKFAGAIYCPTDESGDARLFTHGLEEFCANVHQVGFMYGVSAESFETIGDHVRSVVTTRGSIATDAVVVCAGVSSPDLSKRLGVRTPIYPIKGYSVTLPVARDSAVPHIGGVDEDNLVAFARFGDRFRFTATAEFAGYDRTHQPRDFEHMLQVARGIFPEGLDYDRPTYWAGLRPMTPEGTPLFGRSRFRNAYLNVGHGHMGWTMAAGSARITADILSGRKPAIDISGMNVSEG